MKTDNTPKKISWDSFIDNDQTERKISQFGKMNVHVADMTTNIELTSLFKAYRRILTFLNPFNQPKDLLNIFRS